MDESIQALRAELIEAKERLVSATGVSLECLQACQEVATSLRKLGNDVSEASKKQNAEFAMTLHGTRALIAKLPQAMQASIDSSVKAQSATWTQGVAEGAARAIATTGEKAVRDLDAASARATQSAAAVGESLVWIRWIVFAGFTFGGALIGAAALALLYDARLERMEQLVQSLHTRQEPSAAVQVRSEGRQTRRSAP